MIRQIHLKIYIFVKNVVELIINFSEVAGPKLIIDKSEWILFGRLKIHAKTEKK